MAKRPSRKRRDRSRGGRASGAQRPKPAPAASPPPAQAEGGYARSRAKNDAARASLKPLRRGERPRAVTVAAVVAALLALANFISLAVAYDPDEPSKAVSTIAGTGLLVMVAFGMWHSRYWAVLGMQALLAITIVLSGVALVGAVDLRAALLATAIIATAGTLFWYLVKAMARIQMPPRPGSARR